MALGRIERDGQAQPMSEINMTPLIDVMLVLMIIFMITAPLLTSNLKLQLPKVEGSPDDTPPQALHIAIDAAGVLHLNEKPIEKATLEQVLIEAGKKNAQTDVQLRCDANIAYGQTAEIIGLIQKSGLQRVGLLTQMAEPASPSIAKATSTQKTTLQEVPAKPTH